MKRWQILAVGVFVSGMVGTGLAHHPGVANAQAAAAEVSSEGVATAEPAQADAPATEVSSEGITATDPAQADAPMMVVSSEGTAPADPPQPLSAAHKAREQGKGAHFGQPWGRLAEKLGLTEEDEGVIKEAAKEIKEARQGARLALIQTLKVARDKASSDEQIEQAVSQFEDAKKNLESAQRDAEAKLRSGLHLGDRPRLEAALLGLGILDNGMGGPAFKPAGKPVPKGRAAMQGRRGKGMAARRAGLDGRRRAMMPGRTFRQGFAAGWKGRAAYARAGWHRGNAGRGFVGWRHARGVGGQGRGGWRHRQPFARHKAAQAENQP